jgi:hypothetical protein
VISRIKLIRRTTYKERDWKKGIIEYTNYDGICFTSIQSNAMTSMISSRYFIMKFCSNSSIDNVRTLLWRCFAVPIGRRTFPSTFKALYNRHPKQNDYRDQNSKNTYTLAQQRRQRVHKTYGDHKVWFSCSNTMLKWYVLPRWLTVRVQSAVNYLNSVYRIFPSSKSAGYYVSCVCVWNLVSREAQYSGMWRRVPWRWSGRFLRNVAPSTEIHDVTSLNINIHNHRRENLKFHLVSHSKGRKQWVLQVTEENTGVDCSAIFACAREKHRWVLKFRKLTH